MGMDVFGHNPTTEEGKYFRNSVWYWRPLADYANQVAPDITGKCQYWQSNDGDGLDSADALKLAAVLQAEIDSGRCEKYARIYNSAQERMPDVPCDLCDGTGTRKPVPHIAMKWDGYPNLRLRPHSPHKGRGRLQRQVRRAFVVCGPVVSSSVVYDWCYARRRRLTQRHRHSVWRVLREIAVCVGRAPTIGRPWLWRLRNSEKP